MVLIEELTGSTVQIGVTILAFTLPGVIFSPVAGVVVDRLPKRWVMVISNLTRVLLALSYVLVLQFLRGPWQLLAFYSITFLTASLAQFFSPAEQATIPLLVGVDHLIPANALFTLTMAVSQALGLMVLGPVAVSLVRVQGGFVFIAAMYLAAALLVSTLPRDQQLTPETAEAPQGESSPGRRASVTHESGWQTLFREFREGWRYVLGHVTLRSAMAQLVTVTTLVMVMAMIAPGFAARVLGMNAENAIIVFAPAGVGMLLATGVVGRWGHVLRRVRFGYYGLILAGITFAALGLMSLDYTRAIQSVLHEYSRVSSSLTGFTMACAFSLGLCLSAVNILNQTTLQKDSPAHLRGRVFSVQYMLNSLVGIPPMLALGGMADAIGIPSVLIVAGAGAIVMSAVSVLAGRDGWRPMRSAR
jgi:MFS family permease